MNSSTLLPASVKVRRERVPIGKIIIRERQRPLIPSHVDRIQESLDVLGHQIVAIAISEREDGTWVLIDGNHRCEGSKRNGEEFIVADIYNGLTPELESLLELETNRLHAALSPAELQEAWENYYEPLFKVRAKQNRSLGVENLRRGGEAPVTGVGGNREHSTPVSLEQAAMDSTGMSLKTLKMVGEIREVMRDEKTPEPIREAAIEGMQRLQTPGTSIGPVYNALLKLKEAHEAKQEVPEVREAREAEALFRLLQSKVSLLAQELSSGLSTKLVDAAGRAPNGDELLRSVRVELTKSLAFVVSTECRRYSGEVAVGLEFYGREVTKSLSELTIKELRQGGEL